MDFMKSVNVALTALESMFVRLVVFALSYLLNFVYSQKDANIRYGKVNEGKLVHTIKYVLTLFASRRLFFWNDPLPN